MIENPNECTSGYMLCEANLSLWIYKICLADSCSENMYWINSGYVGIDSLDQVLIGVVILSGHGSKRWLEESLAKPAVWAEEKKLIQGWSTKHVMGS